MKLTTFRRVALGVVAPMAAIFVAVAPVSAIPTGSPTRSPYPLPECAVTTNQGSYSPGDTAVISGSGGTPGGSITFTITFSGGGDPVVLVGQVDQNGNTSVQYIWPNRLGSYSITATCEASQSPPTTVVVSKVPSTGSDSGSLLRAGALLVLVGSGLWAVARLRRRRPATA